MVDKKPRDGRGVSLGWGKEIWGDDLREYYIAALHFINKFTQYGDGNGIAVQLDDIGFS
jgi:hypothetical protein